MFKNDLDPLYFKDLGVDVVNDAPLTDYTTFQLGGPCRTLLNCRHPHQLERTIAYLSKNHLPFILIGGGSNIVVSDHGVDCHVIRYKSSNPLIEQDGNDLIVTGSTLLDHLALFAAENSLEGLNYASGIPGTVGGAIVGNAGAFGRQIGDVVESIELISKTGAKRKAEGHELKFSYRDSLLKETEEIIISARFCLIKGHREQLLKERQDILQLREQKHPNLVLHPSAGSIFRNIEPTSRAGKRQAAGWFLEQAGAKSLKAGGAVVFEKHANIIVKEAGGCAQDVFDLTNQMAKLVQEKYDIRLIREVRFVGEFEGMPADRRRLFW